MARSDSFAGSELDWLAIDEEGALALFATAGSGFVPASVLAHVERHQALCAAFEEPDRGTPRVWDAQASLGLYVYDWKPHRGPYRRVRSPMVAPAAGLRNEASGIPSLPVYPGSFRRSRRIAADWHVG